MKTKLIELSEIIKQKPEIKERLERLEFGCWISTDERDVEEFVRIISTEENGIFTEPTEYNTDCFDKKELVTGIGLNDEIIKIIGREPQYSDVLEYLGDEYVLSIDGIEKVIDGYGNIDVISLFPGLLAEQSDETIDKIISLCKNNVPRN